MGQPAKKKSPMRVRKEDVMWDTVLTRSSDGDAVSQIAADMKVPRRTLLYWLHGSDLEGDYRVALEARALHHAEKVEDLIRLVEGGKLDPHAARVAIDSRKCLACKFYPKQFGERQTVSVEQDFSRDYLAILKEFNKPKDITPKPLRIDIREE